MDRLVYGLRRQSQEDQSRPNGSAKIAEGPLVDHFERMEHDSTPRPATGPRAPDIVGALSSTVRTAGTSHQSHDEPFERTSSVRKSRNGSCDPLPSEIQSDESPVRGTQDLASRFSNMLFQAFY